VPDEETDMADITEHEADQIDRANAAERTPIVFVHGLHTRRWARSPITCRGLSAAAVAIDPAPFRGVLPTGLPTR
jgi:hypothetical protein